MTSVDIPFKAEIEAEFRSKLSRRADQLIASMKPAVRFRPDTEAQTPIGTSRFGGQPDLEVGRQWPTWEDPIEGTRTMWFFAQIDLADANASGPPGPLGLPEYGLLSFFADFDAVGGGITGLYSWEYPGSTILYTAPGAELAPLDGPTFGEGTRLSPMPVWTWRIDGLDLSDEEFDAIEEIAGSYDNAIRRTYGEKYPYWGRHQLGGNENVVQHPVAEEVVQALAGCHESATGGFDAARWQAVQHEVADWQLILQIDSDDNLDVMWGDAGTLYWLARTEDIAMGRWDRCAFNLQCF